MVRLSGGGMYRRRTAESVIDKLLREQAGTPVRSPWHRFRGRSPLGKRCEGWYLAALGEMAVGKSLEALSSDWTVFHALPIGLEGWDIDHLIVGPGGVITVNAKQHRGARILVDKAVLTVNGRTVPYLRHAEFEANHVTDLMSDRRAQTAPVRPTVVFVGAREVKVRERPPFVTVLGVDDLVGWLEALPVVLDQNECGRFTDLFDNPAMWANVAVETGDDLIERFQTLDAEVRAASRQRRIYVPLAIFIGGGAGFFAIVGLVSEAMGLSG